MHLSRRNKCAIMFETQHTVVAKTPDARCWGEKENTSGVLIEVRDAAFLQVEIIDRQRDNEPALYIRKTKRTDLPDRSPTQCKPANETPARQSESLKSRDVLLLTAAYFHTKSRIRTSQASHHTDKTGLHHAPGVSRDTLRRIYFAKEKSPVLAARGGNLGRHAPTQKDVSDGKYSTNFPNC